MDWLWRLFLFLVFFALLWPGADQIDRGLAKQESHPVSIGTAPPV